MATPIGHALAGYAVYCAGSTTARAGNCSLLWWCLFLAVSPDLDFLPGIWKGQPALHHQGISHSFGFAIFVGLVAAMALHRKGGTFWAYWGLCVLAYSSHLVMDLFAPDLRPPYGIPLFWPLSDIPYLAPFQIFLGVRHAGQTTATTSEWVSGVLDLYNVGAIGIEVFVIIPMVILVKRWRRRKIPGAGDSVTQRGLQ